MEFVELLDNRHNLSSRNFTLFEEGGVTFHSLLVTCCKITRYSLQKLLVAKNHSLLVAKFARYPLQKLLVAKNYSLLVAEFASHSFQKLLIPKNYSLLVAEVVRFGKSLEPTKKLNKDIIEISVIYILPLYPFSRTLSTLLPPNVLHKYKNLEIQWIHQ